MSNLWAAVVGGVASSAVAGFIAWRQGKAAGRAERLEELEERLRRLELRTAAMRAGLRVERRKHERRARRDAEEN